MVTNNDINGWVRTPFGEGDLRTIIPSDVSKSCDIAVVRIYYWTIAGGLVFVPTSDVYAVEEVVKKKKITMDDINQIVSDYLEISKAEIQLNTRKRETVEARQVCMFFSKKLTKNSLSAIGNMFGNKDHATVLHAEKTILNRIETEPNFEKMIKEIHNKLAPGRSFNFDKKTNIKVIIPLLAKMIKHDYFHKSCEIPYLSMKYGYKESDIKRIIDRKIAI